LHPESVGAGWNGKTTGPEELAQRMDSELSANNRPSLVARMKRCGRAKQQGRTGSRQAAPLLEKFRATQATGRVVIRMADIANTGRHRYDVKLRNRPTSLSCQTSDEVLVVGRGVQPLRQCCSIPMPAADDYVKQAGLTRMAERLRHLSGTWSTDVWRPKDLDGFSPLGQDTGGRHHCRTAGSGTHECAGLSLRLVARHHANRPSPWPR